MSVLSICCKLSPSCDTTFGPWMFWMDACQWLFGDALIHQENVQVAQAWKRVNVPTARSQRITGYSLTLHRTFCLHPCPPPLLLVEELHWIWLANVRLEFKKKNLVKWDSFCLIGICVVPTRQMKCYTMLLAGTLVCFVNLSYLRLFGHQWNNILCSQSLSLSNYSQMSVLYLTKFLTVWIELIRCRCWFCVKFEETSCQATEDNTAWSLSRCCFSSSSFHSLFQRCKAWSLSVLSRERSSHVPSCPPSKRQRRPLIVTLFIYAHSEAAKQCDKWALPRVSVRRGVFAVQGNRPGYIFSHLPLQHPLHGDSKPEQQEKQQLYHQKISSCLLGAERGSLLYWLGGKWGRVCLPKHQQCALF